MLQEMRKAHNATRVRLTLCTPVSTFNCMTLAYMPCLYSHVVYACSRAFPPYLKHLQCKHGIAAHIHVIALAWLNDTGVDAM